MSPANNMNCVSLRFGREVDRDSDSSSDVREEYKMLEVMCLILFHFTIYLKKSLDAAMAVNL